MFYCASSPTDSRLFNFVRTITCGLANGALGAIKADKKPALNVVTGTECITRPYETKTKMFRGAMPRLRDPASWLPLGQGLHNPAFIILNMSIT